MAASYDKLFRLLQDRKVSIADLKQKCDLDDSFVEKLKSGEYVSLKCLERISLAFNCGVGEILEFVDPKSRTQTNGAASETTARLDDEIDIVEQKIADYCPQLLDLLLIDRTTSKYIVWASEDYAEMGELYGPKSPITPDLIVGKNSRLIQPRVAKTERDQITRTRNKAEVFTPAWVCNAQNNLVDETWFGRKNVFNRVDGATWTTVIAPIAFPEARNRSWQKYVDAKRIEITCGEAPYLVSRYDAASGVAIPIPERVGLLDRKLRVVCENANAEEEWLKWTTRAFESVYGYEFQGDNLLLARENLLYTFIDYLRFYRKREPTVRELMKIATVISWNLWQMDGVTCTIPYGRIKEEQHFTPLFDDLSSREQIENGEYCKPCRIKDWRSKTILEYKSLLKETRR